MTIWRCRPRTTPQKGPRRGGAAIVLNRDGALSTLRICRSDWLTPTRAKPASRGERVYEELIGGWHTATMPSGRHLGHRAPSIADKARIARANRTAADQVPVIAELRAAGTALLRRSTSAESLRPRGAVIGTRRRFRGC
jgi:hypothetical protein